jgi:hypothetical protein
MDHRPVSVHLLLKATEKAQSRRYHRTSPSAPRRLASSPSLGPSLPFPPPLHGRAVSLGCLLPYRRRHVRRGGEPGARRPPRPLCQGHPEGAA